MAMLTEPNQAFRLVDANDYEYTYDLSSVWNDGGRWLHFSIWVTEHLTVQSDCLISAVPGASVEEFESGKLTGIRFQPFYLPESGADPEKLVGKGLIFRGFHFPGTITRGNVSLMCICDYCRKSFRLQSFHAGFSNVVYFFCSDGPHTLITNGQQEGAPPILGKADRAVVDKFDEGLPRCEKCSGSFGYYNPLRCPHCSKPYIDFETYPSEREAEYYASHLWQVPVQEWNR